MKSLSITMVICITLALLFVSSAANADTNYLYGIHDFGANGVDVPVSYVDMETTGVKGWVVVIPLLGGIGHNSDDYTGFDFRELHQKGYTPICRLDNSTQCDGNGTLPYESQYYNFARRCANFVANSPGCHIWIIGNEPNRPEEWPTGERITVSRYVNCYTLCYDAIKAVPGHAGDIVCPAAVCTWQDSYPAYPAENPEVPLFDDYFAKSVPLGTNTGIMYEIPAAKIDGIVLHPYTHGSDPSLITDTSLMGAPFSDIYYHFQVYKNYIWKIPPDLSTKPIYITETGQIEAEGTGTGWADEGNYVDGYIPAMYNEINTWNTNNPTQKIRCVALYRWGAAEAAFDLAPNRDYVRDDWKSAMTSSYMWTTTATQDDAGRGIDAGDTVAAATAILPALQLSDLADMDDPPNKFHQTGDHAGYVDSINKSDYYKFYTLKGQTITVSMAPPTGSDFDLYLYNPSGASKGTSLTRTAGAAELVNFTADVTGYWVMRVYRYSGSGTYLFSATLNYPTAAAPTGTIYYPTACNCDSVSGTGYECTKAYDANTATSWKSAATAGEHWITFNLGQTRAVKGFQIYLASTAASRARRFKVQTAESLDGTYVDEKFVDNRTAVRIVNCTFPALKVIQYVRLVFPNCGTDNPLCAEVSEIRPYCTAVTLNIGSPYANYKSWTTWVPGLVSSAADSCIDGCTNYYSDRAFDAAYVSGNLWWSANTAPPHWIKVDLGVPRTVYGMWVRHAGQIGLPTTYNTRNYQIQIGPSYDGPWTTERTITGNTADYNEFIYSATKQAQYFMFNITDPGDYDNAARIPEIEIMAQEGNDAEYFDSMPVWSSTCNASWGNGATWSNPTVDGHTCLKAVRSGQGSSTRVKTYTVTAYNNLYIYIETKVPMGYTGGPYWVECLYKMGTFTATDCETNRSTWYVIDEYSDSGCPSPGSTFAGAGVGSYFLVNTLNNTTISIAFRYGTYNCAGPTEGVCWDTLKIN